MNKRLDLTHPGGVYAYQDTLKYMQDAYASNFDLLAKFVGDKVILDGVVDDGSNVSAGWISYNGELIPFTGGAKQSNVLVQDVGTDELYDDGIERPFYYAKTAKMVNAGGTFPLTDLKRLAFDSATIYAVFDNVKSLLKKLVNIEPAVIINGMKPKNEGLWTLLNVEYFGGTAMFDGVPVDFSDYSGPRPVYATQDGSWVNTAPVSGLYITFDPYTSQYLGDVKKRAETPSGKIEMYKVLLNRFELDTGLGRWEWLGWKICDDMQDRVPLGFDRRVSNPDGGLVWDANYTTVGNTGGEKKHTLIINEIPSHSHSLAKGVIDQDDPDWDNSGGAGSNVYSGASNTGNAGGGQGHENRQPYRVILFLEKI